LDVAGLFSEEQNREILDAMPKHASQLDLEIFERQSVICKAFAHPKRLQLLDLIGKGERAVAELQVELNVSKANMSQHLSVLRSAGVVTTHRNGKQVYCALAIPEVKNACQLLREVLRSQLRQQHKLVL
jgi:ArsR family transcriptional regulator, virulence genes transcriptional regulator